MFAQLGGHSIRYTMSAVSSTLIVAMSLGERLRKPEHFGSVASRVA